MNQTYSQFSTRSKRRSQVNLNELSIFTKPISPQQSISPQKSASNATLQRMLSRNDILTNYLTLRPKLQHKAKLGSYHQVKEFKVQKRNNIVSIHNNNIMSNQSNEMNPNQQLKLPTVKKSIKDNNEYVLQEPRKPFNYRYLILESANKKVSVNYKLLIRQLIQKLLVISKWQWGFPKFTNKPFQRPNSYEFVQACKNGNAIKVKDLLKIDRSLVFSFDFIQQTGLHWAVKRGHNEIAHLLVVGGCEVDAVDLIGRPALHFAIENENVECVRLLLEYQASPWSMQKIIYSKLCKENMKIMNLLNKARKIHIIFNMVNSKQRMFLKQKLLKGTFE